MGEGGLYWPGPPQLPVHRSQWKFIFPIGHISFRREGGLYWPGPPQLPVHRSEWKFIFPIGHISFRIRLDLVLKLIRNYINPIGFAVQRQFAEYLR